MAFHRYFPSLKPEIIVRSNDSIWPGAIGAFLGAFFAFIFGLITFYLQKKFDRYWKHKNAIVEIEQLLNDHLNESAANQFLLEGAVETLKRNHMTYTLLTNLRLLPDIELRIGDLDILNKYSDYKEPVVKVNHGMKAWQGINERLHQNVISNPNLPAPIIHKNMEHIQKQAEDLIKFLKGVDANAKKFLTYIRIYMRKDKHFWSTWLLRKKNKTIITPEEIRKESEILNKEITEISAESRKRIAKIMKNNS